LKAGFAQKFLSSVDVLIRDETFDKIIQKVDHSNLWMKSLEEGNSQKSVGNEVSQLNKEGLTLYNNMNFNTKRNDVPIELNKLRTNFNG
jgi:hypothetical protein